MGKMRELWHPREFGSQAERPSFRLSPCWVRAREGWSCELPRRERLSKRDRLTGSFFGAHHVRTMCGLEANGILIDSKCLASDIQCYKLGSK